MYLFPLEKERFLSVEIVSSENLTGTALIQEKLSSEKTDALILKIGQKLT